MIEDLFKNPVYKSMFVVLGTLLMILLAYWVTVKVLSYFGKNPKYLIPPGSVKKISLPLFFLFFSFIIRMGSLNEMLGMENYAYWFKKTSTLLFIFSFTWLLIKIIKLIKQLVISNYDVHDTDNLKARKIFTQFTILERVFIFILIIFALGIALMSFDSIKEIGISIFASAGVAGIIIGFSAQKMIGAILAGVQIAIAQPIKIDDVVVIEGEWGRIEQITLTYVVIAIWDKRRLVVPTTYFIEKPIQNWTKSSSDIIGTVYLYTDYRVPIDALRKKLTSILKSTELWNGQSNALQVTNATDTSLEIRALMSAKDASTAWDLRVLVREKMITFLQKNYPQSLPHTRVFIKNEGEGTPPPKEK
ncbi:mechanosensitive ion channel family protein [Muriicola sp.]|uniref:mechanosensitive ion channel family protein n=1 Tax=Muriicola sp. TaxID=2020856 RepID=UPI003C73A4FF